MAGANKIYRLGVIGFAHMHVNSLIDSFAELPDVQWIACADTVPEVPSISTEPATRKANLRRALEVTGIPKAYDDYREMLDKEEFDILIFCPENARHGEVAEAIAAKGAHMLTEKPMAASLSEALRMARAARAAGVTLMVNWPTTWSPAIRKAKDLIDAGEIGDIWEVKWRNGASMGPLAYGQKISPAEKGAEWWHQAKPGGGALLDYCCYGACLSRWYLGKPAVAAYGLKANLLSHYGDAEDNAVIAVRFPSAVAILEGTWTTFHTGIPTGPIIYGSNGTIVVDHSRVLVYKERGSSSPTNVFENLALPEGRDNPAKELIHHLETGEPLHPTLDLPVNLDAMAILDAGIRSAVSGKLELANDINWCIG
ncbi:MAG TPA: Gfo/Idh/MocA family oxidoreductase [Firmicutes bacterium]|nr:Gfo/Idh/MocA family oxidoreductase [Bacillota bacterium]HHY97139.1 Gfo/Idh/MocA family oxidoreductase [Bacillota bacterium]